MVDLIVIAWREKTERYVTLYIENARMKTFFTKFKNFEYN